MLPNSTPSQQEFSKIITYLTARGVLAQSIIGDNPTGRSRRQITSLIIDWLKTRPAL